MNYQRAIGYLKKNKVFSVYFLWGKEVLLKEHFLKTLLKVVFKGNPGPMNYKVVYGTDFQTEGLINFLSMTSLFGGRKVFVLRGYGEIKIGEKKKLREFLKIFTRKETKNIFVIMDEDLRKDSIVEVININGMVVEFNVPDFQTLVNWVRSGIEGRGKKIEEDAIYLLLAHRGEELMSIKNEIDKLITYSEDESVITVKMVAELLGLKKGVTIFDLLQAFRRRETSKILSILEELSFNEPLPKILFTLEGEIRKLIGLKIYREEGADYATLKEKMGLSPRILNEMIAHLPKFSKYELFSILQELYKVNLMLRENYSLGILPLECLIEKIEQVEKH